jgi:hypothetical protein
MTRALAMLAVLAMLAMPEALVMPRAVEAQAQSITIHTKGSVVACRCGEPPAHLHKSGRLVVRPETGAAGAVGEPDGRVGLICPRCRRHRDWSRCVGSDETASSPRRVRACPG